MCADDVLTDIEEDDAPDEMIVVVLEDVVKYTFQQVVYYLSKVRTSPCKVGNNWLSQQGMRIVV